MIFPSEWTFSVFSLCDSGAAWAKIHSWTWPDESTANSRLSAGGSLFFEWSSKEFLSVRPDGLMKARELVMLWTDRIICLCLRSFYFPSSHFIVFLSLFRWRERGRDILPRSHSGASGKTNCILTVIYRYPRCRRRRSSARRKMRPPLRWSRNGT